MINSTGTYQISGNAVDVYTGLISEEFFTDVIEIKEDSNGELYAYFGAGLIPTPVNKLRKDLKIKKVKIDGYINGRYFKKYVA